MFNRYRNGERKPFVFGVIAPLQFTVIVIDSFLNAFKAETVGVLIGFGGQQSPVFSVRRPVAAVGDFNNVVSVQAVGNFHSDIFFQRLLGGFHGVIQ